MPKPRTNAGWTFRWIRLVMLTVTLPLLPILAVAEKWPINWQLVVTWVVMYALLAVVWLAYWYAWRTQKRQRP